MSIDCDNPNISQSVTGCYKPVCSAIHHFTSPPRPALTEAFIQIHYLCSWCVAGWWSEKAAALPSCRTLCSTGNSWSSWCIKTIWETGKHFLPGQPAVNSGGSNITASSTKILFSCYSLACLFTFTGKYGNYISIYRTLESLRMESTSGDCSPIPVIKVVSVKVSFPGLCLVRLWIAPRLETPNNVTRWPSPLFNHPHSRKAFFSV